MNFTSLGISSNLMTSNNPLKLMILIVCLNPTQLFSLLMYQPAHYTPLLGYDFVRVLTTSGMFLS